MYYVYILENSEGERYIGQTSEFEERIKRHNSNRVRSTKNKGPWKLIYREEFHSRQEAFKRERQIKKYKGGEALKQLLKI